MAQPPANSGPERALDVQSCSLDEVTTVDGLLIHEIHRGTGLRRKTIRRALESDDPPRYERPPRRSKLDPFKDEIQRLLREDARIPAKRIRELFDRRRRPSRKPVAC